MSHTCSMEPQKPTLFSEVSQAFLEHTEKCRYYKVIDQMSEFILESLVYWVEKFFLRSGAYVYARVCVRQKKKKRERERKFLSTKVLCWVFLFIFLYIVHHFSHFFWKFKYTLFEVRVLSASVYNVQSFVYNVVVQYIVFSLMPDFIYCHYILSLRLMPVFKVISSSRVSLCCSVVFF